MTARSLPFPKFGTGVCFERVTAIAEALDLELAAFGARAAVITGSNGKGSVAAMLANLLGGQVGRFTSPHLFRINERFWLAGEDISDAAFDHHWARVEAAARAWLSGKDEQLSAFEFLFLIAADWFAAQECAHTVWEAGIGGRYDPTRLIRAKHTALVSLDLEHTQLLGNTLEHIAYDKLDAAPAGARVFIGESCAPLRARIETYASLKSVAPVFVSADELGAHEPPLAGPHQRDNTALALAMARAMRGPIDQREEAARLAATTWPGRLEIIERSPLIVIDVGHTPAAMAEARKGFEAMAEGRRRILVCGVSADKDAAGVIAALAPGFDTIICAAARHKGRKPGEIAALAAEAAPDAEIIVAEELAEARRLALARGPDAAVFVAGGLFLATEFKALHQGLDPKLLAFF